jgi:hypothetical protein
LWFARAKPRNSEFEPLLVVVEAPSRGPDGAINRLDEIARTKLPGSI